MQVHRDTITKQSRNAWENVVPPVQPVECEDPRRRLSVSGALVHYWQPMALVKETSAQATEDDAASVSGYIGKHCASSQGTSHAWENAPALKEPEKCVALECARVHCEQPLRHKRRMRRVCTSAPLGCTDWYAVSNQCGNEWPGHRGQAKAWCLCKHAEASPSRSPSGHARRRRRRECTSSRLRNNEQSVTEASQGHAKTREEYSASVYGYLPG